MTGVAVTGRHQTKMIKIHLFLLLNICSNTCRTTKRWVRATKEQNAVLCEGSMS